MAPPRQLVTKLNAAAQREHLGRQNAGDGVSAVVPEDVVKADPKRIVVE